MKPGPAEISTEVLSGLVERVTFHNEENGFAVLRVKARGKRDLITVVGHAAVISAGEFIQASGDWNNDRQHGLQFRARFLTAMPPTTVEGIEKYLGSGMIRGIGPVYAGACIRREGFDIIEAEPDRLREVSGIGPFDPDVRFHHCPRPCLGRRRKRGQQGQALGRSRGGFTTKSTPKADNSGGIIAFDLTGSQVSDTTRFEILLKINPRAAWATKAIPARPIAPSRELAPVIPHKANGKNAPVFFAKTLYKACAGIGQGFGLLRRVALRCEKPRRISAQS